MNNDHICLTNQLYTRPLITNFHTNTCTITYILSENVWKKNTTNVENFIQQKKTQNLQTIKQPSAIETHERLTLITYDFETMPFNYIQTVSGE